MLGWSVISKKDCNLRYHKLSSEEEEILENIEKRYGETARGESVKNREQAGEWIKRILEGECRKLGIYLDGGQEEYLLDFAVSNLFGFCFIDELLETENIEEISIIGIGKPAYVFDRKRGWLSVNAQFDSEEKLLDVINKMAKNTGRRITLKNPRVNAVLEDGSRIHATLPPISNGELTIRKFRKEPFGPGEIARNKTCDGFTIGFLSLLFQSDSNIIIAGNTASGKTSTLNSLFSFIPMNERILLIEETPEIFLPHKHQIKLIPNEESGINLSELVYDSLRMRPDRTIVGEIRKKEEAVAMMDAMLSGQARGGYATMHARSGQEAIQRLKTFGFCESDLESIDGIIIQKRMLNYDSKARRNFEIRRIIELYDPARKKSFNLPNKNIANEPIALGCAQKIGLTKKEFAEEITKREQMVSRLKGNFEASFMQVQKQLYGLKNG